MHAPAIGIPGRGAEPLHHQAAVHGMQHAAQLGFLRQHADRPAPSAAACERIEIVLDLLPQDLLQFKRMIGILRPGPHAHGNLHIRRFPDQKLLQGSLAFLHQMRTQPIPQVRESVVVFPVILRHHGDTHRVRHRIAVKVAAHHTAHLADGGSERFHLPHKVKLADQPVLGANQVGSALPRALHTFQIAAGGNGKRVRQTFHIQQLREGLTHPSGRKVSGAAVAADSLHGKSGAGLGRRDHHRNAVPKAQDIVHAIQHIMPVAGRGMVKIVHLGPAHIEFGDLSQKVVFHPHVVGTLLQHGPHGGNGEAALLADKHVGGENIAGGKRKLHIRHGGGDIKDLLRHGNPVADLHRVRQNPADDGMIPIRVVKQPALIHQTDPPALLPLDLPPRKMHGRDKQDRTRFRKIPRVVHHAQRLKAVLRGILKAQRGVDKVGVFLHVKQQTHRRAIHGTVKAEVQRVSAIGKGTEALKGLPRPQRTRQIRHLGAAKPLHLLRLLPFIGVGV